MISPYHESNPFDKQGLALVTIGIFKTPNPPRSVTGVYVPQALFVSDFCCPDQSLDGGVGRVSHLVIFVKRRHMPGDIGRYVGQESGDFG